MPHPDAITISLLGKPVPGNRAQTKYRWIPKNQQHAMDQIKLAASDAMRDREMLTGAVHFIMAAEMPIPNSWPMKKKTAAILGQIWPTVKPDLKNIAWLAEDALKSVVYRDDCVVCRHSTIKRYSEQPKIVLTIEPLE